MYMFRKPARNLESILWTEITMNDVMFQFKWRPMLSHKVECPQPVGAEFNFRPIRGL